MTASWKLIFLVVLISNALAFGYQKQPESKVGLLRGRKLQSFDLFRILDLKVCHTISTTEHKTESNFFLLALFNWLFRSRKMGDCASMCEELCTNECYANFDRVPQTDDCQCFPPECSTDAQCIGSLTCECNAGFVGSGYICCDTSQGMQYDAATDACRVPIEDVRQFVHLSGGVRFNDSRFESFGEEDYQVDYDVTVTDSGIVALDSIQDRVEQVVCSNNGAIVDIKLLPNHGIPVIALTEMYPPGSILIINHNLFGACETLSEADFEIEAETEGAFAFNAATSFDKERHYGLSITSVTGTFEQVRIEGTPTDFMDMFDQAQISAKKILRNDDRSLVDFNKPISVSETFSDDGLFEVTVSGTIENRGTIGGTYIRKDQGGSWNLELNVIEEIDVRLGLQPRLKAGFDSDDEDWEPWDLIEPVILLGGELDLSEKVDPITDNDGPIRFKMPTLTLLSVSFRVPLHLKLKAALQIDFDMDASLEYNSGRQNITYYYSPISGPGRNVNAELAESSKSITINSPEGWNPFGDNPVQIDLDFYLFVRPQFLINIMTIVNLRGSLDYGPGVLAKLELENAFKPLEETGAIGVCDTCHYLQVMMYYSLKNVGFFQTSKKIDWIEWENDGTWTIFDFDEYTVNSLVLLSPQTLPILQFCFLPAPPVVPCTNVLELPTNDEAAVCDASVCQRLADCVEESCTTNPVSLCMDICEVQVQYVCTVSSCDNEFGFNIGSLLQCNPTKCEQLRNCIRGSTFYLTIDLCELNLRYECTVNDCSALGINVFEWP